jgi:hypothetical protein
MHDAASGWTFPSRGSVAASSRTGLGIAGDRQAAWGDRVIVSRSRLGISLTNLNAV